MKMNEAGISDKRGRNLKRIFFYNCVVPLVPWEIGVAFPWESQLRQSRAAQPTVHAGCFSVSLIHRTGTWTTGSLTGTQI